MGIDFGDKRIGIALTDLMRVISSPYEVYNTKNTEADINYLCKLIKDKEVGVVVFGLPLNMDGTEGDRAKITREFALQIANKSKVDVVFQDERLSSVEAEEILVEAHIGREERKKLIDKLSASIILESYLNEKGVKNGKR